MVDFISCAQWNTLWYSNIAIENHHFLWENTLFLWPCSLATFVYQRVIEAMTACVEAEEWQVALQLFNTLEDGVGVLGVVGDLMRCAIPDPIGSLGSLGLVVWNIFIFPYVGNNHPIWLIFIRVQTTNQVWCND